MGRDEISKRQKDAAIAEKDKAVQALARYEWMAKRINVGDLDGARCELLKLEQEGER